MKWGGLIHIHFFQHESYEDPGCIGPWALENGYTVSGTRFYKKESLPSLSDFDMLVVMGGPMNVYEEEKFPWLLEEKRLLLSAVEAGKIVLGVCLGAQLIACVLGARVYRNTHKEIGWFPVTMNQQFLGKAAFAGFPNEMIAFHWHGDTFDLPVGAKRFAFSELTLNQGFQYGETVFGFQFHLECTEKNVRDFVAEGKAELQGGGRYIQTAEDILSKTAYAKEMNSLFVEFLDYVSMRAQSSPPRHSELS